MDGNQELLNAIRLIVKEEVTENNKHIDARFDAVEHRLDVIEKNMTVMKGDIAGIQEDVVVIREDAEVTRNSTNLLLDWADKVGVVVHIPLLQQESI